MFLILDGNGELRFGSQTYEIRKHDVIACPAGGPSTAHQIVNTGTTTLRYLSVSSISDVEVCEYPDSNKIGIFADGSETSRLRATFRAEATVEYYDRESLESKGNA